MFGLTERQWFSSKVTRSVALFGTILMSFSCLANFNPVEDRVTLNIFSLPLEVNVPSNWKQIRQDQLSNMYSAEFLPENETMNQWTQLICVQGFNNVSDSMSPETFLESFSLTYNEHCQGDIIFEPLGDIEVKGYKGTHGLLGCTKMPNTHTIQIGERHSFVTKPQGEMGYYTVLMADNKLILFHKSIRNKVFSPNHPPFSRENYQAFVGEIFPNKL
ncbi:hypothetical protein JQC92_11960 [Shewanella sp. 202IG2-18]|uniref:hypothetical protein n=1 Tax=Parashewanella hymeniacidonis TaxID=2807618 RepID=UPI00195FABCB|nr:hypothetical protein [Parashewanella hymeniacidonis]MBM7072738.1 hypothetical protein [Parashewanella hymeniacidonis]